jgi:hypothetical protein
MAKKLTTRKFFEGTSWEFTMNPGPFNIKEHVLITIFANSGAGTVYATHILTAVKLYYKRKLTFVPALFVMITTQVCFLFLVRSLPCLINMLVFLYDLECPFAESS